MRNRKKTALLLFVALSVTVMTAVSALHGRTQNGSASSKQEEPTVIQEGVMTEKQKKHSKIFKGFEGVTRGRKLRDLIAERGDIDIREEIGTTFLPPPFTLHENLQRLTCEADAVVIGTVKSKSSQLIEEGTFVFTDYEVAVEETLKNNLVVPIQQNTVITVTRSGGTVKLNGHIIRAIDHRDEPLEVGEHYLFYLKFLPETGAYRSFGNSMSDDTLRLHEGKVTQVSRKPLPLGRRITDVDSFITEVRIALNSSCTNKGAR